MKSELTEGFISSFSNLPDRIKKTARNNYKLWKDNPYHPSLDFKAVKSKQKIYSIRVGIGWRALGIMKEKENTVVWFWIGSHSQYDKLLKSL